MYNIQKHRTYCACRTFMSVYCVDTLVIWYFLPYLSIFSNFYAVVPSIIKTPSNQTILESSNATFHCSATGNPTPKVTWIKDGKTVATGERLSFEANRVKSGKYWCSADNGLSEAANASANLDVQCKFEPHISQMHEYIYIIALGALCCFLSRSTLLAAGRS